MKEDLEGVKTTISTLESWDLSEKSKTKLTKVLFILAIGELYGHHTLHSIMDSLGIQSNNYQKIWQKYSCQSLMKIFNEHLSVLLETQLKNIGKKSASTHSRNNITIIIDGSIFKQWLEKEFFGKWYAKYFSGQTHKAEYGFHLVLIGFGIGKDFYPFRFHILRKDKGESAKIIGCKLLVKCHLLLERVAKTHGVTWGKLYVSVDSGFRCKALLSYCEQFDLEPIISCVKSHNYIIEGKKAKLSIHIENMYESQEKAYQEEYTKKGETPPAFTLRVKAYYPCMKICVILVFFRINHSKKVSVVWTTDLIAKAKTVRRRFFQRVKIEQFFRFVKHTLKIQQSTSKDFTGFLKKVALFFLKAVLCQSFQKKYRKMRGTNRKMGFERIRRNIIYNVEKNPLEQLVFSKTFCIDLTF